MHRAVYSQTLSFQHEKLIEFTLKTGSERNCFMDKAQFILYHFKIQGSVYLKIVWEKNCGFELTLNVLENKTSSDMYVYITSTELIKY